MNNIYEFSSNLKLLINNSDKIFLVPHIFSDIDTLSSCFAMYKLASSLNKNVYIIFNDDITKIDDSARKFINDIIDYVPLINISTYEKIKTDNDLIITLDFNKKKLICDEDLLKNKSVIIDHHNLDIDHIDADIKYIDTNSSSAAEIMYYLLNIFNINIDEQIATYILAGIYLDTNEFKNIHNPATMFTIGNLLKSGADLNKVKRYFAISFIEDRKIQHLVDKSKDVTDNIKLAVDSSNIIYKRSELAKAADYLLKFNIDASFATGFVANNLISISSRSNGKIDVSKIMAEFNGGGNNISAAARINSSDIKTVEKKLKYIIKNKI